MNKKAHLRKKQIVDSLGRNTTVYVSDDEAQTVSERGTATATAASSDFLSGAEDDNISVLDPAFKDVLLDRYGVDPRDIDEHRNELMYQNYKAQQSRDSFAGLLQRSIKDNGEDDYYTAKWREKYEEAEEKYREANKELNKFNDENPVEWQQYWLVNDGHFHNTRACSTLRPTTMVSVYPDASGMDEDEAIELAGSRICTHCIPDAPVDIESRPSHVLTKDERKTIEDRQKREEEKIAKEEDKKRRLAEQEAKREARKADPKNTFEEPLSLPRLRRHGDDNEPVVTDDVKKVRDILKDQMIGSVINLSGLERDPVPESNLGNAHWMINREDIPEEEKKKRRDNMINVFGTDRYWAMENCYGDVDGHVENLKGIQEGVRALGEKKGKTFDKMMNDVYGKRTWNTLYKESRHRLYVQHAGDHYDDTVKERFELMKGWINDPESFRDYVNGK